MKKYIKAWRNSCKDGNFNVFCINEGEVKCIYSKETWCYDPELLFDFKTERDLIHHLVRDYHCSIEYMTEIDAFLDIL